MSRPSPLNARQAEVLQWIEQERPRQDWPNRAHKTTALALQRRGLIRVSEEGDSWSAEITDAGRYYLTHKRYRGSGRDTAPPLPAAHRTRALRRLIEVPDLMRQLQANAGVLVVKDPKPDLRASYLMAIRRSNRRGEAPAGHWVRYSGKNGADLIIRLERTAAPVRENRGPRPPVPRIKGLQQLHEVVAKLAEKDSPLDVSNEARPRAVRILQAIADETERRQYLIEERPGVSGFRVSFYRYSFRSFNFDFREEKEVPPEHVEEETPRRKPLGQDTTAEKDPVPTGRLVLRMKGRSTWADCETCTLVEQLPRMFAELEAQELPEREAHERAEQKLQEEREERHRIRECERTRREEERRKQRALWEVALAEAHSRWLVNFNRARGRKQALAWREACELRRFATDIRIRSAQNIEKDRQQRMIAWADQIDQEANRIDPLTNEQELDFSIPEHIAPQELDTHMPPGMTARQPPEA